jgi:putative transposase
MVYCMYMGNRLIPLVENEFYHIYNRGVDKRTTFLDVADYRRFIELLYLCNSHFAVNVRDVRKIHNSVFDFDRGREFVAVGAYCLMPNHFHLLLTPVVPDGISLFMKKTKYGLYFLL